MPPTNPLASFKTERVPLDSLTPHPRNYRKHPEDQLEEIRQSLREFGFYRNVVVSEDDFILAGHGVCEALGGMDADEVEIYRLPHPHDHPRALKLLAADNELSRRAEIDDRVLTEILRDVKETDETGLAGTGYDEKMLAALLMVTRPASEIEDFDAAAEWVGMPDYDSSSPINESRVQMIIHFEDEPTKEEFIEKLELVVHGKSAWWPPRERMDRKSARFETE